MINHTISECSKLAQKEYKTRHDWPRKRIRGEFVLQIKIWLYKKWHMHKPEYYIKNKTNNILYDFKIQRDHLIR